MFAWSPSALVSTNKIVAMQISSLFNYILKVWPRNFIHFSWTLWSPRSKTILLQYFVGLNIAGKCRKGFREIKFGQYISWADAEDQFGLSAFTQQKKRKLQVSFLSTELKPKLFVIRFAFPSGETSIPVIYPVCQSDHGAKKTKQDKIFPTEHFTIFITWESVNWLAFCTSKNADQRTMKL